MMSLHFIQRNAIATKVPQEGSLTFKEIADQCGLDESDTKRILRLAMTDHLFMEKQAGSVSHSAATLCLATNPLLAAWIGVTTQENWPSMLRVCFETAKG